MLSAPPFDFLAKLDRVDDAIDANADIADQMVDAARFSFESFIEPVGVKEGSQMNKKEKSERNSSNSLKSSAQWHGAATAHHLDKARSTLRQFYRDWSAEGADERQACYGPVWRDLETEFLHVTDKEDVKVLVPGAGLGRLVFEICLRGYVVEGNEISWHQLIASNWVLNFTAQGKTHDLYPFAAEFSNVAHRSHQLQRVHVPDIRPGSAFAEASESTQIPCTERLGMSIGDFIGVYSKSERKDEFDAIVTVFFIDTAPNVIRYIETVRNCLKSGGVWTNLGPLLWHFEDRAPTRQDNQGHLGASRLEPTGIEEPGSFELTDEELLLLVERMGFDIVRHAFEDQEAGYVQNPTSMLQNKYRPSHWVARKR